MGTINYKTSDYVTIGYNLNNIDYAMDDFSFDSIINDDFDSIARNLRQQFFIFFNVKLEPGYYEGFSIDIECNFNWCLNRYQDKKDALKEITRIKNFLLDCIKNYNLCAVSPGWCTTYYNEKESIQKLNDGIKEMREHVKRIPTYYQLKAADLLNITRYQYQLYLNVVTK